MSKQYSEREAIGKTRYLRIDNGINITLSDQPTNSVIVKTGIQSIGDFTKNILNTFFMTFIFNNTKL